MANFTTHLTVASIASTALATFGFMGGLFGFGTAVFCLAIGIIGGLLPDIDLETSTPAKRFFNIVSIFVSTLTTVLYVSYHGGDDVMKQVAVAWMGTFVMVRYVIIGLFSRLTVHRGMVHSVPYMAMCGLFAVHGAFYGFGMTARVSWFFGGFLFMGALVHLVLDEIYSVNVLGLKLKKSSGTAFKFFESKKSLQYTILYMIVVALFWYAPDHQTALNGIRELIKTFAHQSI